MSRCRHIWKVIEKQVLPSFIEQMRAAGATSFKGYAGDASEKPALVHIRCETCGSEDVKRV